MSLSGIEELLATLNRRVEHIMELLQFERERARVYARRAEYAEGRVETLEWEIAAFRATRARSRKPPKPKPKMKPKVRKQVGRAKGRRV